MGGFVQIHQFESAKDFLDALQPFQEKWNAENWLFRGHWNATEWRLRPSLWRISANQLVAIFEKQFPACRSLVQKFAEPLSTEVCYDASAVEKHIMYSLVEYELLRQFAECLDDVGIDAPDLLLHGPLDRAEIAKYCQKQSSARLPHHWPSSPIRLDRLSRFVAKAQHHGIPTRLLDWTQNGLIGAFFAVWKHAQSAAATTKAATKMAAPKSLQVWALRESALTGSDLRNHFRTIRVSAMGTERIRTQQSRFTIAESVLEHFLGHHEWPSIDQKIQDIASVHAWGCDPNPQPILLGHEISTDHADSILELLNRFGITEMRVMPSADSVSKSLLEKWGF